MNCFLFIFMITLTVVTSNPYDVSYGEIVELVNNLNSLKEENEKLKEENINLHEIYGKYNVMLEQLNKLGSENHKLEKVRNKLKQKFKDTKRTLEEATTKNNALKSFNEQLETENQALKSSNEQCETEHQALKRQMQMNRPGDCTDVYLSGYISDGVYTIYVDNCPMQVYCEMSQTQGSIVIQKRYDGSLDYKRMFQEYSDGFGDLKAEHWRGLSFMNRITATGRWKLRIELGSFQNETRYAEYSDFKIGSSPGFQLLFDKSSYKGDAGDSLGYHHNMKFSARDKDQSPWTRDCSGIYGGSGWWFNDCMRGITTGMPYRSIIAIYWSAWKSGLKSATLKIKKF